MLSKPQIKIIVSLIKGNDKLKTISQDTKISTSWVSTLLNQLVKLNFVKKERKGNLVKYYPNATSPIQKLIKFINTTSVFDFELFLTGLNLRILMFCVFSPKTTKIIAENLGTSVKAIQNRTSLMQKRGLLVREKHSLIKFNEKMYPVLEEFLKELRMSCDMRVNILWKFENRILFETKRKEDIKGILTGFSKYSEFKIPIYSNIFCCYLPEKKLNSEEIFTHSILEIDHTRLVLLALTFYLKNKLNKKKLEELAREYDCSEKLEDLKRILRQEKTKIFSFIKEKELKEFFRQYGVKWKRN